VPDLQPFSAWKIGKVTDLGQHMGDRIQTFEIPKHSNQQVIVGFCVLASPLERLDAIAVHRANSEEHKKVRIDQEPGTGG
jgi:hypothetical protein